MFCTRCGEKIDIGENFCTVCGESVDEIKMQESSPSISQSPPSDSSQQSKPSQENPPQPTKAKKPVAIICILAVIGIAVAIGAYLLFFSENNRNSTIAEIERMASRGIIDITKDENDNIIFISGAFTDAVVKSEKDAADVLNSAAALFGDGFIADESNFTYQSIFEGTDEESHFYMYSAMVNSIPVLGSQIIISTDSDGKIASFSSTYDDSIYKVDTIPTITSSDAIEIIKHDVIENISDILEAVSVSEGISIDEIINNYFSNHEFSLELVVYAINTAAVPALTWIVSEKTNKYYMYANGSMAGEIFAIDSVFRLWNDELDYEITDIRGETRKINVQTNSTHLRLVDNKRNIEVYDTIYHWLWGTPQLPGEYATAPTHVNIFEHLDYTVLQRNDPNAIVLNGVRVLYNMAYVYDFFKRVLGCNSFDNNGGIIRVSIDYNDFSTLLPGTNEKVFYSAAWSNTYQQFVYGYIDFEKALDIAGHEFVHAINNHIHGGREYSLGEGDKHSEASALDEAYADIIGNLIERLYRVEHVAKDTCQLMDCWCNVSNYDYRTDWRVGEDAGWLISDMSVASYFSQFDRGTDYCRTNKKGCIKNANIKCSDCTDCANCCHQNGQIFRHAVYLMMNNIGDINNEVWIEKWVKVFYGSLGNLQINSSFTHAALAVIESAKNHGFTTMEIIAIECAFYQVGIFTSTDHDKSLCSTCSPPVTPSQSPSPTPTNPGVITAGQWQQYYINEVSKINQAYFSNGGFSYKFIFINDDDIPELLLEFSGQGLGEVFLYTATNSSVDSIVYEIHPILTYIEHSNKFVISGGRMDDYYDVLYEIRNGSFVLLHEGNRRTRDTRVPSVNDNFDFNNATSIDDYSLWEGKVNTLEELIAVIEGVAGNTGSGLNTDPLHTVSAWQQHYINAINDLRSEAWDGNQTRRVVLFYLDGDDIPEIAVFAPIGYPHRLITVTDVGVNILEDADLPNFFYIERSGSFRLSSAYDVENSTHERFFELQSGQFVMLHEGYPLSYSWNGERFLWDWDKYLSLREGVFDFSKERWIRDSNYHTEQNLTADQLIELIGGFR